ncbi:ABC transporter permease [Amphibacillus sp. Q70]|uniref:ABC transporter permease n=1 Tax=Amphibacillus sp. Q70 TaxID=3453416 RepID=UPI003F87CB1A
MNKNDLLQKKYDEWKQEKRKEKWQLAMLSFLGLFLFFVVWQLATEFGLVNPRLLPPPTRILETLVFKMGNPEPDGNVIFVNIFASLQVALSGFFLANIIGIPLGLIMGWWPGIERFMRPIFELIRPIPPIAWIPLVVVWFGIGLEAKALIIFFTAFVPCVINSYTGIKLTNQTYINVSKTFGASNFEIFRKVGIPYSLKMVFSGIRIALNNSWSTLVAAEMLAASAGLGYMIQLGRTIARPDIVIVGMAVIGGLGALLSMLLSKVEKRFLRG